VTRKEEEVEYENVERLKRDYVEGLKQLALASLDEKE